MKSDPTKEIGTVNLENLTIGVFAIVMTLLVLDIRPPEVGEPSFQWPFRHYGLTS